MPLIGKDSLQTRRTLSLHERQFDYYSIFAAEQAGLGELKKLPKSLKVLLENLLRHEDGRSVKVKDIESFSEWLISRKSVTEIAFRPARVLMQDFTGVPAIVDLAAMRDAMNEVGGDPNMINPLSECNLVFKYTLNITALGKIC